MTHRSALPPRHSHAVRPAARRVVAVTLAGMSLSGAAQTSPAPLPRERVTVEAAFARVDTNHDGLLSREEAARLPAIADKFDSLDLDRDQRLSPQEFAVGLNAPV